MTKVIFLCTGNTCRSQMAEGFACDFGKGIIEAYSAGLAPAGEVHPRAIAVMKEQGIDISQQKSKGIDIGILQEVDVIITLCGHAEESCPWTSTPVQRIHWPINDPVRATGTDEEIMNEFRTSRDEIRKRLLEFIEDRKKGGVHGE
jgi:arsenate reductase